MHKSTPTRASTLVLPPGQWPSVFACLCDRFPAIAPARWRDRFERGRILDHDGNPLDISHPYRAGLRIHYFREVPHEKPIPFDETVLHVDEHLLVVDKPHFLPVVPAGDYVEQTLLARLIKRFDNPELTPLHRIDRHTAGLVLFSTRRETRAHYQALFRERGIDKTYEAIAPALPQLTFPHIHVSRIERGEPFFLSRETEGSPNSETRIDVIERRDAWWHYRLHPVSGKKHQLRLHMAALGAPIRHDPFYPVVRDTAMDDHANPLQLLARALRFIDPLSGNERTFTSRLMLSARTSSLDA